LFWKVWDLLKEKYVNKNSIDAQKMVYGAIQGMLNATGDHYTTFFDPTATKSFSQDLEGSFEGIGAELGIKDDILTVIAPLDGSPSAKAGLRAGDKIIKIDGKSTSDVTIDAAVDLIRGKKGTTVTLTVLHAGDQETKDITITRDTINVKSVTLEIKPDNIAYVKISKFGDTTSTEFDAAVNQIVAKGAKGIVLDLRNNPGGYLEKAVDIASRLIPKGKVVVMEEDNTGKRDSLYTTGGDKLSNLPIVVLINEGSASASEILAGALRDDRQIQLIGKKSFGKGSVQELINLPQNTSVKITVAKWLTPNGDYIMEKGINPDTEVDLSLDDFNNNRDPQLDKAMSIMKGTVK
jgi:carboxyl-terminal processing protease